MDRTNNYIHWLRGLVERNPGPSFNILFDAAWNTVYEFHIPNDDNRAEDGLKLRERFELESSLRLPDLGECRILEFLIALAIRLNESVYDHNNPDQTLYWFWELIKNLQLDSYDDNYPFGDIFSEIPFGIEQVFARLNERLYAANGGAGGLFPLEEPRADQRHVEVWYQMMAYLAENVT